jgi:hypothetical protein
MKMNMKKTPWLDEDGKFKCSTCKTMQSYLLDKTGKHVEVHKTDRYLVFNYVKDGNLDTMKIELPAGVLYCVHEEHLAPVVESLLK